MFDSIQTKEDFELLIKTYGCNYTKRDCKNCPWRFRHYTPDYISDCLFDYSFEAFKHLIRYDVACSMIDQAVNIVRYLIKHNKLNSKYYLACNKDCYEMARDYLERYKKSLGIAVSILMYFDKDIDYGIVRLRKAKTK